MRYAEILAAGNLRLMRELHLRAAKCLEHEFKHSNSAFTRSNVKHMLEHAMKADTTDEQRAWDLYMMSSNVSYYFYYLDSNMCKCHILHIQFNSLEELGLKLAVRGF